MDGATHLRPQRCQLKEVAAASAAADPDRLNGIIQHSFALRIPRELKSQYMRDDISDPRKLLSALLGAPAGGGGGHGFRLMSIAEMGKQQQSTPGEQSLLVKREQATVLALPLPFVESNGDEYLYKMPLPFDWAALVLPDLHDGVVASEGYIPTAKDAFGRALPNDYLIVDERSPSTPPPRSDPVGVSWLLCQLLAHRRSRLFGWSLERRIFNVLLPHGLLRPFPDGARRACCPSGEWIAQPALSLFLAGKDRGFRPIFSLTMFMIPVRVGADEPSGEDTCDRDPSPCGSRVHSRTMSKAEIYQTVQAGWSVATSRHMVRPLFTGSGPLCDYVAALDASLPDRLGIQPPQNLPALAPEGEAWSPLTLRQATEASLLAVSQRMVSGPAATPDRHTRELIGERVLVALSASRASSVVVVDEKFEQCKAVEKSRKKGSFPGLLGRVMEKVGGPIEISPQRAYRLDRSFFDEGDYAIGVLPANRCVVMTAASDSQKSFQESGLLEAGWIAYMVIGAATATGMMRSIYHEIEEADQSNPSAIAAFEREVVVDLHELYDLDITWEQYRHRYSLLRTALGITRDYEALQCKLQALSRETTTRFEDRAQARLAWLTAAIVFLTLVVVIVTVLHK